MNAPTSPSPSPPFGTLHAILWMSTAFFWMLLGAILMGAIRSEAISDMVSMGALSAAVFLLTAAMLTGRHPAGDSVRQAIGLRPTSPWLFPLGLVGGALAQIPAEGIFHLLSRLWPGIQEAATEQAARLVPHGPVHGVLLVLVLALLVPFAEEAFFRGAVYGALRRAGNSGVRAGIVTGLGFTLTHDPTVLLPIFLVALYLTFLRIVSGSLWPSLAAHIGFNLVTMLSAVLRLPEDAIDFLSPIWQASAAAAIVATVLLTIWLGRGQSARASRLEEAQPVDG